MQEKVKGRDAPVGDRGRHRRLRERQGGRHRSLRSAPPDDRASTNENGLRLVAGATHPFADWRVQDIYPDERYLQVVEDLQMVARANLIFGLQVHVGIEDKETRIHLMNQLRVLSAAPARALHELPVLDRHEHRA
jgi:hypothetical protein